MPVYNRQNYVGRSIDSVMNQSYSAVELIVIDDGSTDGTLEILRSYGSSIRLLTQQHGGPYVARNLGLSCAKGRYIAFIDSDDVWTRDKLACQMPLFSQPATFLVYGNGRYVDYRNQKCPGRELKAAFDQLKPRRGRVLKHLAQGNFIPQSSVVVRAECFGTYGPFPAVNMRGADYFKWLQIARHHEFDYVDQCVFEYAVHDDNFSYKFERHLLEPATLFRQLVEMESDPGLRAQLAQVGVYFNLSASFVLAVASLRLAAQTVLGRANPDIPWKDRLVILFSFAGRRLFSQFRRLK
jgi:glycosyltransferase involved in cell wall biosynthesis